MKRLVKLAITAAVSSLMITPLVTLPVPVNPLVTVTQAEVTPTVPVTGSVSLIIDNKEVPFANIDTKINDDEQLPAGTFAEVLPNFKAGQDQLDFVQAMVPMSDYMNSDQSEASLNDIYKKYEAVIAAIQVPDKDTFAAYSKQIWALYGLSGYRITQSNVDYAINQTALKAPSVAGSPVVLEDFLLPTEKNLTGNLILALTKPNQSGVLFDNHTFDTTDKALAQSTITTAYALAYPNTKPIDRARAITNYLNGVQTAEQAVTNYNQATGTTLTTTEFLQLPEVAQDTYNLKGYEIDDAALAQTLATDISQTAVTQAKIADITLNIPLKKIAEKPEVTIPPVTGETGLPDYNGAVPGKTAKYIYGIKALNLYRSPNLTAANKVAGYAKQRRVNRPVFKVIGYEYSNAGRLRYKVKDVNAGRKTYRKTGYITARTSFTKPLYYTRLPKNRTITVINKTGIYGYQAKSLTGKRVHYKKGTHLKVKKVFKHNLTTRYQLTNGRYITTNNKFIIAGRY